MKPSLWDLKLEDLAALAWEPEIMKPSLWDLKLISSSDLEFSLRS